MQWFGNSMMGEISPKMAEAIASSSARKLLLPVSKCNIDVIGLEQQLQFKTLVN
ncbi:MAG TPA: hypothetical protein DHU59_06795 [Clostridiales bacterium]|nr:hypothetical protein [Clostridiales bacterium]